MPTYEYRCADCGNEFEVVRSFSAPNLKKCPRKAVEGCQDPGKGNVKKVFAPVGISFKGSGFYKNDARSSSSESSGSSDPGSSDSGSSDSGSSDSAGGSGSSKSGSDSGSGSDSSTGSSASGDSAASSTASSGKGSESGSRSSESTSKKSKTPKEVQIASSTCRPSRDC